MIWLEPPKGFSLSKHLEKVKAVEHIFHEYLGRTMSEPLRVDLLEKLCARRRYPVRANVRTRAESIIPMDGMEFNAIARRCLALFLVEHDAAFRHGDLPPLWDGSQHIWMCVRVVGMDKLDPSKPGIPLRYVCKVLAINGPAAGHVLDVILSLRYATYFPKMLGCPRDSRPKPADSVTMHTWAKMGTQKGRNLALLEIDTPSSLKTQNREIYRRRNP